jgi:hypothetical protein
VALLHEASQAPASAAPAGALPSNPAAPAADSDT